MTSNIVQLPLHAHEQTRMQFESPFAQFNTPESPILFPVGERTCGWLQRTGTYAPLTSHKAIIRLSPDGTSAHALNVVPHTYRLVHNRELFAMIEDVMCNELGLDKLRGVRVKDSISEGGKLCFREYVFPELVCRQDTLRNARGGGVRSDIAFRIVLRNAYGGASLRMFAGAIEFYCTNGMLLGAHDSTYYKHTKGLRVERVAGNVMRSVKQFVDVQPTWRKWCNTPVTREQTMAFFHSVCDTDRLRNLLIERHDREAADRGDNLWAVYSAMTAYASHPDGEFAPRRGLGNTAATMMVRETRVRQWTQTPEWSALVDA